MKAWLRGFYFSFPVQMLFLHFRKYQVLLVFWFMLFSTVGGSFMKGFGADSLFLAPEYLDQVSFASSFITGIAIGMFIMSWNISTFILFSRQFRFLSATTNPFLKYCINNSVLPLIFLLFYAVRAFHFTRHKELMAVPDILWMASGFILGILFLLGISFLYFFRADISILRIMMPVLEGDATRDAKGNHPRTRLRRTSRNQVATEDIIHVESYFESFIRVRPARDVRHYAPEFVDSLFKRHHFAAILTVFATFLLLVGIGFFLEIPYFQIPAAASITMLFAILIGVAGAFSYFMQSWSIPFLIALLLLVNFLYRIDWIDPRNKGYGLNYQQKQDRPAYTREGLMELCTTGKVQEDRDNMIGILEKWKARQNSAKPLLVLINTSGGGHRSATFTMSVLQQLDSLTDGAIMRNIFLINGASGGMIGASYYRELYRRRQLGQPIDPRDPMFVDDIAKDLLNPLFSSFVTRDLIAPAQKFEWNKFSYVKDRGYAFEEKLNKNTHGFLDKPIRDYAADEHEARIPLVFYNSVVTRDSRKLLISTQPVSFMMQGWQDSTRMPVMDPDVVDFSAFFRKQDPGGLRLLTALRMNATFPIVLPNVWLPSEPVIDVMDAGLRDNYGQETTLRFLESFDEWIRDNTGGVLIVQIRDRSPGGWEYPYISDDITDHATKPFLIVQNNWFKMMEYFQNDMLSYYASDTTRTIHKVLFQYAADKEENKAALNFHLSRREKLDIINSVNTVTNKQSFVDLQRLLQGQ